jgi:ribosomal protein L3
MHARVAVYKFRPAGADIVIERAKVGMVPIFRQQPGFIAYVVVKTADDAGVSISAWETAEQAEQAVQAAAAWVKANVAEQVVAVENHVGDVAFTERK